MCFNYYVNKMFKLYYFSYNLYHSILVRCFILSDENVLKLNVLVNYNNPMEGDEASP